MNSLYLTYDGISDPLGESQILPYLKGISKIANIHVISFEKASTEPKKIIALKREFEDFGIKWDRLVFSESRGLFSKTFDFFALHVATFRVLFFNNIDIVHARGLPPAIAAACLRIIFKFRLLYDMRGLWVDERITKGGWRKNNFLDRVQYQIFKFFEKYVIKNSDKIITLTKTVIPELESIDPRVSEKITTIPCAADFDHFYFSDKRPKAIKLEDRSFVLGYLGSVGPLYQFSKFLDLYTVFKKINTNARALVVTNNLEDAKKLITKSKLSLTDNGLILVRSSRNDVPNYINCMDVMVSFCTNAYSAKGASPTKIGEALACGIPIVSNKGIGDTDEILRELNAGIVLPSMDSDDFPNFISRIQELKLLKSEALSKRARRVFDLNIAIAKYQSVYETI